MDLTRSSEIPRTTINVETSAGLPELRLTRSSEADEGGPTWYGKLHHFWCSFEGVNQNGAASEVMQRTGKTGKELYRFTEEGRPGPGDRNTSGPISGVHLRGGQSERRRTRSSAAIVRAFTTDENKGRPKSDEKSSLLTISEFAALEISGNQNDSPGANTPGG